MKIVRLLPFLFACCCLTLTGIAQQKKELKKTPAATGTPPKATAVLVPVTLGHSALGDSVMTPEEFNRRVEEGLKVADAHYSGAIFEGFDFTYLERNIYEDSIGNLIPVVDVLTERCPGDTFTTVAKNAMRYRAKNGDTALFNNMRMRLPDGRLGIGREFKVVIQNKK